MKVVQGRSRPLLSKEGWDFLDEAATWGYKNAPASVIWMWAIQKKLIEASSRRCRGDRIQMLKRHGQKSSRSAIKNTAANNATLQESLTETREAYSRLKEKNRNSKGAIDLSLGGSSVGRLGGRLHHRGPVIRPRESYAETTIGEE